MKSRDRATAWEGFFGFCLSRARDGDELRRVGAFFMLKLKTMETDKELAQIKYWAKIAERNAWKSLVGLTWHVKSTYEFCNYKKRAPPP